MNKKLTIIIFLLLLIQVAVYFYVNKNEERINRIITSEKTLAINDLGFQIDNGHLDLSNQNLEDLSKFPKIAWTNEDITSVNLRYNQLERFPYVVLNLPNLQRLSLGDNQIKIIDLENINIKAKKLQVLEMRNNALYTVNGLEKLSNLVTLNLSLNRIFSTPELNISTLKSVDLSNNRLQYFNITRMNPNLEKLNLGFNYLNTFDVKKTENYQLKKLNLINNPIKNFPKEISRLTNLKELNLNFTFISDIDFFEEIPFSSLQILGLSNTKFKTFDFPIEVLLPNLKQLTISNDSLQKVAINHSRLLTLSIHGTAVKELSLTTINLQKAIINFTNLRDIKSFYTPSLEEITFTNYSENISVEYKQKIQQKFNPATKIIYKNE